MPSSKHIWYVKGAVYPWHFMRADGSTGVTDTRADARRLRDLSLKEAKHKPKLVDDVESEASA